MAGELTVNGAAELAGVLAGVGQDAGEVSIRPGEVIRDTAGLWKFYAGGNPIPAIWCLSGVPHQGAPVLAIVRTPKTGLSTAWVIGSTADAPYQGGTGKVLVVNGDGLTCSVLVEEKAITCKRLVHYTPAVNDNCLLQWHGGSAYMVGRIGSTPPPAPPPPPPPTAPPPAPTVTTGTSPFSAVASGTWTTGYNWNSYFGTNVYSGSGYVPPSSGHWFYNGATKSLAGKTITDVKFYLPARRQAGNYNSTATVHFYRHSSNTKGSSVPSVTVGPYNVNVAAHWGGGYIDLPNSFGDALKAGGGITISGDPYVGFTGISGASNSGHLKIAWKK